MRLRLAIELGLTEFAGKVLQTHTADITNYDIDIDYSPLVTSVCKGHENVVRLLVQLGADTPAMYAFHSGDESITAAFLPYMKSTGAITNALIWAIESEAQASHAVRLILKHPMLDVNDKTRANGTALYFACTKVRPDLVDMLLRAGADENILHNQSRNPQGLDAGRNVLHTLARGYMQGQHLEACDEDVKRCVELVFAVGVNVHQVDARGNTALHGAKDATAVRRLLDAGADANATNQFGEIPLHKCRDDNIFKLLTERNDINAKSKGGRTPLVSLLANSHKVDTQSYARALEQALQLMKVGADVTLTDDQGNSALHHAVRMEHTGKHGLPFLEALIASGADVNLRNNQGEIPLHTIEPKACAGLQENVLTTLINTKADTEAGENKGRSPLMSFVDCLENSSPEDVVALFKKMVEVGALLDTTDSTGRTLLHATTPHCRGDTAPLRYLADHGVDPTQTDKEGNTLWHIAIPRFCSWRVLPNAFYEIAALGVHPRTPNKRGQSPLHVVCSFRQWAWQKASKSGKEDFPTIFDYIVAAQEDVDCPDDDGVTGLHLASTFAEDMVSILLSKGADPSRATHEELTPLHLAARSRQANIMGHLLDSLRAAKSPDAFLATIDATDSLGRTALYYACASGRAESVAVLLDHGATLDSVSFTGSAWSGCADFEEEQSTPGWHRFQKKWAPLKMGSLTREASWSSTHGDLHLARP
ncbi:Uu.00g017660.m01.CDS01 [Anthostomella pinea]|uniref:Uu.00g017660.m01.CDS01 n=1 Tax=Anthostomella pinea TaxID=933095 RepID=A0AAI8VYZ0_9PEZI|nr:Uu.00g017660.m01.CDS01 [Anthostomella pinea]